MVKRKHKHKHKKKPRAQVKSFKKATERDQRLKQARSKAALATAASLVQGMLNETERCLRFDQQKHSQQAERVRRWSNHCLDAIPDLGVHTLNEALTKTQRIQETFDGYIRGRGPSGIGHYAVAWIVLGYVVDEARYRFVESQDLMRRWNFFVSVTNTFAEMFLESAEEDRDYEELAGEAAIHIWDSIFGLPEGSWIRL